ncbi:HigA family addiction module antitoxin [Candidatus Binatus soli]|uniref:HigA family addiction module antitoxin n=1 Tax=Candidatus Binatus soli TaxID=1953413 RepID=UPI003D0E7611
MKIEKGAQAEALGIMPMKNPPHVGGLIRREVIEPLGLTVTEAAKVLGVGRQALSSLLNGKAALTSEMGLRIEKAFGPKMEHLMRMQLAFDLAQARKAERGISVKRYLGKREGIIRDAPEKKPRSVSTA